MKAQATGKWKWEHRSRQDHFCVLSWVPSLFTHTVWTRECLRHVPTSGRRNIGDSQVATWACLSQFYCILSKIPQEHTGHMWKVLSSLRLAEVTLMFKSCTFSRTSSITWATSYVLHIGGRKIDIWRSRRVKISNQGVEDSIHFGCIQCF